ncbi:hypothetical protein C5S39_09890 [Candidatus Methanophagaceae archaeon]|nr:hypothetical protein C5S39_09890 [Methanophagales archaeon]
MGVLSPLISAIIGLVVGTLFGGWLERILYRPRVVIEIESESPYLRGEGKYVSVVVSNKGQTAAIDCVGSISIDELSPDALLSPNDALEDEKLPLEPKLEPKDQLLRSESFREINRELLCWAHIGNPPTYTINPGTKTLLDVFKAIERDTSDGWYLIIPSEAGWKTLRVRLKDGNYHGRLVVSPKNGPPKIKEFEIRPSSEAKPPLKGPQLVLKEHWLTACLRFAPHI